MSVPIAFKGEVMLAGWSETHNGGAKVTFWLQDSDDLDAFKAMTVAKGKHAGQRLAIIAVEIDDDEQPKAQPHDIKRRGGELARLAGQLCQNPEFQAFVPECADGLSVEENAAAWIRKVCGVTSRAELDHNPEAAARFHELVRKPFLTRKVAA